MSHTDQTIFEPYWPEYRKQDWVLIHQHLASRKGVAVDASLIIQTGLRSKTDSEDDDYLEFAMSGAQFEEVEEIATRLGIIK
jgi:hypothetical protein